DRPPGVFIPGLAPLHDDLRLEGDVRLRRIALWIDGGEGGPAGVGLELVVAGVLLARLEEELEEIFLAGRAVERLVDRADVGVGHLRGELDLLAIPQEPGPGPLACRLSFGARQTEPGDRC